MAAALLAAALPGAQAQITAAAFQQSTYGGSAAGAAGETAGVAGLMWQGTPKPLTPTNFTVMFPYALTAEATALREGPGGPAGNTRVEIHLPGFGGAYNSFGASSPSSTDDDAAALEGPFLPIQNGIRPYSRRYGLKKEDVDAARRRVGVTAANSLNEAVIDQCIAAAEWDPKREVLKITAESGDTPATVCDLDYFNGVTIDEGYLRQLFDRHGLPSGKGPLPPLGGIDETWFKKAWVRTYPAASCSGAGPNRAGLGSETCDPDETGVVFSTFSRDVSANMQFETTNDWVPPPLSSPSP